MGTTPGFATPPAPPVNEPADGLPDGPTAGALPDDDDSQPAAGGPDAPGGGEFATPPALPRFAARLTEPMTDAGSLGGLDADAGDLLEVRFSDLGAGIDRIELARFRETLEPDSAPAQLQQGWDNLPRDADGNRLPPNPGQMVFRAAPFAAVSLRVEGVEVDLTGASGPVWRQTGVGSYEALISDTTTGIDVVRVTRRYRLEADSYTIRIEQHAHNLTDTPLQMVWTQFGPIDLEPGDTLYGGEKRRVRFGWLLDERQQRESHVVSADGRLEARSDGDIIGTRTGGLYDTVRPLWPDARRVDKNFRLVWNGFTDRYFGVGVARLIDPGAITRPEDKVITPVIATIDRIVLNARTGEPFILRYTSENRAIAPGEAFDLSLAVYAGPLSNAVIRDDALATTLGLAGMVEYKMVGGFCGLCTFEPLTHLILAILGALHTVTLDWALAIILLVVCVRGVLHPITRFSQSRMQIFGVQMQSIAPKVQKLKEKYKDDPKKMAEEQQRLWAEEGISPAGMLGCLPMFLQSPVWIALYATLFFDIDLRHEAAFFGVFQSFGGWAFLNDLAAPDHAIPLPSSLHFNMPLMGQITSINVLPLLLGAVFFVHQKFMTPPTTATMTPEQQAQQRMMKIMSVVMFPVFMYNAPSGLTLYFITNSTLGIIESKWIRASLNKKGLLDADNLRARREERRQAREAAKRAAGRATSRTGGKKVGFMDRLRAAAEEAQRQREENLKQRGQQKTPFESNRDSQRQHYKKRK